MLFLPEILKFKTAFGKLWLAGTIGAKKKPFNKEIIINADIEEFVQALFNVDVPLSPRLNGTFLCGVCAIYDQKFHYFQLDVMSLFRKIHFVNRVRSHCDSERTKRRKKRTKTKSPQLGETTFDEPNMDAILEEMELDPIQVDLNELQRQEREETENLEALIRSQLYDNLDEIEAPVAKRPRHEARLEDIRKEVDQLRETSQPLAFFDNPEEDFLMNEDDLFHNLAVENSQLHSSTENDMKELEMGPNSPPLEQTPPPLNQVQKTVGHLIIDGGNEVIEITSPKEEMTSSAKPHPSKRRRRNSKSAVVVDMRTCLPDETLTNWRADRSAIMQKTMPEEELLSLKTISLSTTRFISERLRRVAAYLDAPRPTSTSPSSNSETSLHAPWVQEQRNGDVPSPGADYEGRSEYNEIEQLRGIFGNENQEIDGHDEWVMTAGRRGSVQSGKEGVLSPASFDESGIGSRRSSLMDPFKSRDDGRLSSDGLSLVEGDIDMIPSRRASLASHFNEEGGQWWDHSELLAAVSPSTISYPGQLLIETGTASQGTFELISSVDSTTKRVQDMYTLESWRFRIFIEKCLDKEKERQLTEDHSSENQSLSFCALVPPGSVSSLIAARSFYQLLVLASSGDLEVSQVGSDILISNGISLSCKASSVAFSEEGESGSRTKIPEDINVLNKNNSKKEKKGPRKFRSVIR